ncbi:MAG: glycosyltransferase family 4 protein [bacterium]|nr:glycosyltransferase family 4 protein [bacterium]
MKLFYITNARIPTEKAHGLQIMKMCEAFQSSGCSVELMLPFRMQSPEMTDIQDIWSYYDIDTKFHIKYLPTPDFVRVEKKIPERLMLGLYYIQCVLFSLAAVTLTLFRQKGTYYSRDWSTILILCLTRWIHGKRIYFEAHELHGSSQKSGWRSRLIRWMLQRLDGVVAITRRLHTLYADMGVVEGKICVAPDGVDEKRLSFSLDKFEARKEVEIPLDKKIICYTGHLFPWKGVYTLAECGQYLPDEYLIYIVGGIEADAKALQRVITERQIHKIRMIGYVPYRRVSSYLAAADAVVLPNSSKEAISRDYTSPLKLFEYMGSRRPIIASDLPAIREILRHNDNAWLVPPDDPQALAAGIVSVVQDAKQGQKLAEAAYEDVQHYTWGRRAEKIITFLGGEK